MYKYSDEFLITCIVLACISAFSSAFVILAHFKIPQLQKHPGQMIVIICLIQIIYDIHWIETLKVLRSEEVSSGACYYFGIVFNILIFISWNILSCLVLELVIKINYPLKTNYSKRSKLYVAFTLLTTAAEITPMIYFNGFGMTTIYTCSVLNGTFSYWIAFAPVVVIVPLNLIGLAILTCSKGYWGNKALRSIVRTCLSMCVIWAIPNFTSGTKDILGKDYLFLDYIALALGSGSGIILCASRLGSFGVLKKLIRKTLFKKKRNLVGSGSTYDHMLDDISLNVFFQEVTSTTIKDLLILLSMALFIENESSENFSYGCRKKKFVFNLEDYKKIERFFSLSSLSLKEGGIWEYGKDYFDAIKESANVRSEEIFASICNDINLSLLLKNQPGGRSGSLIVITTDDKFVIKIISRKERYFFLDILPSYANRIKECPDSKIVKVFGLYKIRDTKESFIVMENIIKKRNQSKIFDLKGSIDDRYVHVKDSLFGTVLKDKNFLEMNEKICLSPKNKTQILSIIRNDINFLCENSIIDYSLIVGFYNTEVKINSSYLLEGIENEIYCIGIIDFLQEYTFSKRIERLYKRLRCKNSISSCSSTEYSRRFLTFINKIFY